MDGSWNEKRPDMPQRLRRWADRAGKRGRSTQAVGLTGGLVAVVLIIAIAISALSTTGGDNTPAADTGGQPAGTGTEPSVAPPTTVPPTSASPSPSETKEKDDPPPGDSGQGGEDEEPDPEPTTKKPSGTISTGPTSFDAWRTGDGTPEANKYAANWEWPVSDGGLRISGYVLRKCDGTLLLRLNDATYAIEFNYPFLDCVTVQAVNAAGEGEKSTTWVPNNA